VVLVNSNPATIMTDPELADATYIEPTTPEVLEAIIAQEHPDAMLPTVGGQTGLNLALALSENGVLEKYGVQLIGASLAAIKAAEDRACFRQAMIDAGLPVPKGGPAHSTDRGARAGSRHRLPVARAGFLRSGGFWCSLGTQSGRARGSGPDCHKLSRRLARHGWKSRCSDGKNTNWK